MTAERNAVVNLSKPGQALGRINMRIGGTIKPMRNGAVSFNKSIASDSFLTRNTPHQEVLQRIILSPVVFCQENRERSHSLHLSRQDKTRSLRNYNNRDTAIVSV